MYNILRQTFTPPANSEKPYNPSTMTTTDYPHRPFLVMPAWVPTILTIAIIVSTIALILSTLKTRKIQSTLKPRQRKLLTIALWIHIFAGGFMGIVVAIGALFSLIHGTNQMVAFGTGASRYHVEYTFWELVVIAAMLIGGAYGALILRLRNRPAMFEDDSGWGEPVITPAPQSD